VKDKKMKSLIALLFVVTLTGCSTILNMIPSKWDPNEVAAVTDLRFDVRKVNCDTPESALPTLQKLVDKKDWTWMYSESRKNKDVLTLIRPFNETLDDLYTRAKSGKMSKAFCNGKVVILTTQADAIGRALQSRN
jgi:uncharacterized protein YceK